MVPVEWIKNCPPSRELLNWKPGWWIWCSIQASGLFPDSATVLPGLVDKVEISQRQASMISEFFSNLNYSVIL